MKYSIIILLFISLSCKPVDNSRLQEKITSLENQVKQLKDKKDIGFVHAVYFWLKKDLTEAQRKDFEENCLRDLSQVKSIQNVYFGPPANTDREVVDNSYDYAWITLFESAEAEKAYQVDPIHTKFVENYSPIFEKVIVYDNTVLQ